MDNAKYYNDTLAHDFSLFMPKEYREEEIRVYKSKINNANKKQTRNKKRVKSKRKSNNQNRITKVLLSTIFIVGFLICYLLYMVSQYEIGMINNNESRDVYLNSTIIDIYEGSSFK